MLEDVLRGDSWDDAVLKAEFLLPGSGRMTPILAFMLTASWTQCGCFGIE
jgi:hypothetical protein